LCKKEKRKPFPEHQGDGIGARGVVGERGRGGAANHRANDARDYDGEQQREQSSATHDDEKLQSEGEGENQKTPG